MNRKVRNSYVLMAAGGAALLLGGGVAFAFWTSSGSGSGTAVAGDTGSVTITQDLTDPITGLYPGGPGQDIVIDIANPNASDVTIGAVNATVSSTSNVGCTADDFLISGPVYPGGTIAGGATQSASGATISMINDLARNQDACKGVTVTLAFAAS